MKAGFIFGIVLGLGGVLALGGLYPWVDHPRLPSQTRVVANGGRAEQFVVRLPVDKISLAGTPDQGIRATAYPGTMMLPEGLGAATLLLEHFKVRDVQGNVIGVAARHTTAPSDGVTSVWAITIPSRGTLRLSGTEEIGSVDAALARMGRADGEPWSGDLRLPLISEAEGEGGGQIIGGSGEFQGLRGVYSENWLITGVGPAGELQGTLELSTITFQAAL